MNTIFVVVLSFYLTVGAYFLGTPFNNKSKKIALNNNDNIQSLTSVPQAKTILKVPFIAQAPTGNWNPPYDEACEEAALIMVEYYLRQKELSVAAGDDEIVKLIDWEAANGYSVDIGTQQVGEIAKLYYNRTPSLIVDSEVTENNIKNIIDAGYPIIIPAQGQELRNPNFKGDGPPYHMLVIIGYDNEYFYTNDPGTRNGEGYKYKYAILMNAIHDWTGSKNTILSGQKAMIVIK